MNNINNIFEKKEVENKLKNFTEGKDYSVSPSEEPNIKTYTFHDDKLRSMFRGDKIPVRITRETYDGKDYSYRGHFEEGKDYRYSAQHWDYGKDYQGDRGIEDMPDWMQPVFAGREGGIVKHSKAELYSVAGNAFTGEKYWERRWTYQGKGNLKGNSEPKKIGFGRDNELELKKGHEELMNKLDYLKKQPQNEERDWKIEMIKKDIASLEREIERKNSDFDVKPGGCCNCGKKINYPSEVYWYDRGQEGKFALCSSECKEKFVYDKERKINNGETDLRKENHELRQQLTEVQKQLAEVLEELRKLRNNSTGQNNVELDQQIAHNEKLIKKGEKVSEAEIKEQVQKSEALLKGASVKVTPTKNNPGSGSLPYVIGGSIILATAGIISYYLLKRNKKNKVN